MDDTAQFLRTRMRISIYANEHRLNNNWTETLRLAIAMRSRWRWIVAHPCIWLLVSTRTPASLTFIHSELSMFNEIYFIYFNIKYIYLIRIRFWCCCYYCWLLVLLPLFAHQTNTYQILKCAFVHGVAVAIAIRCVRSLTPSLLSMSMCL